jgi:hypothetical protein
MIQMILAATAWPSMDCCTRVSHEHTPGLQWHGRAGSPAVQLPHAGAKRLHSALAGPGGSTDSSAGPEQRRPAVGPCIQYMCVECAVHHVTHLRCELGPYSGLHEQQH